MMGDAPQALRALNNVFRYFCSDAILIYDSRKASLQIF